MNSKKCNDKVSAEILARAKLLRGELVRGELLTLPEAAAHLHIGTPTLYQHRDEIRHFNPPFGVITFDSADLDDWLRSGLVPAPVKEKAAGKKDGL